MVDVWSGPAKWVQLYLVWSSCFQMVFGYYCEWDQCGSAQYCCGDNLCCEYVYSLWYFWVGILFVVIVLSACGGLMRYCYYYSPPFAVHRLSSYYERVPNIDHSSAYEPNRYMVEEYENKFETHQYSNLKLPEYFPPPEPPPSYFDAISMHVKQLPVENNPIAQYP